tara:strand:+ start:2558 stop:3172 length:615 start_codon:yes stop_codon:yes gene_type:complete
MDQQGEILGLFPNVLARKVWNEGSKFNSGMKDLFYRIEKDFPMDNTSFNLTDHYYTSYNKILDKQLIEYDEMKPFVNFLSDNVRNLNDFMGFTKEHEFTIKDMWFAINRKGSYHETHTHTPSIWSGVYYVEAHEDDASLNFFSPSISDNHWASNVVNEYNDFNTTQVSFNPSTSMLNIFPGYLKHSVAQQRHERDRIAISFNIV